MSLIKPKFKTIKARRTKLTNRNKIEYIHNLLKKTKAEKKALVEELEDKVDELHFVEEQLQYKKVELHSEKVNDLKKQVECPVCLDVPRKGPVFTCPNGHLVCQKCKRETCPTCREVVGENKSLIAIEVIEKILHDCKFVECEQKFCLQEIERHEKICKHRVVACPYYTRCDQMVPLSKLLNHLQNKPCSNNIVPIVVDHSSGIQTYFLTIPQITLNLIQFQVTTFLYRGSCLALRVVKSGEHWQFTVVMFESPKACSNINIEMEVYEKNSPSDTRFSVKVRCNPCSIDEPVAETKGLGLYVHHELMKRMVLKDDSFQFTVTFSFF